MTRYKDAAPTALVGRAVLCPPFGEWGWRRARSDAPYPAGAAGDK
ncbi:MAG TPA: hypothetical protein VN784_00715 [Candidatus Limnocylindrales bacterium]|nr:hypothetical protein [Candidatus Limnocylindrales bacterium]